MPIPPFPALFLLLLLLPAFTTSCSGDRMGGYSLPGMGNTPAPPAQATAPPFSMAGRWLLASPGKGQCPMTFGAGAPNATEGTIAPGAGCPGKFFTSRKWSYDTNGLVIRDHNSEPLAQLSTAGGPNFNGQSTESEAVTLTR